MLPTDLEGWILFTVTFIYFNSKDFLLRKIFKAKSPRLHPAYTLILSIIALYVNTQLHNSYQEYLGMSYIKGSISLPPFTLIFIGADFISSVLLVFIVYVRLRVEPIQLKFVKIFMDIMRFFFLYAAFTSIVSHIWLQQLTSQANFNYNCFKEQLVIDAAVYYYRHSGVMPEKLADFTEVSVNPFNNSPLIYKKIQGANIEITDKAGNRLIDITNFIGIGVYKAHPEEFFTLHHINNKNICQGSLKIPSTEELQQLK